MTKQVSAPEIRAAKSYLERRGLEKDISPRLFATAAKEMDRPFKEVLSELAATFDEGEEDGT